MVVQQHDYSDLAQLVERLTVNQVVVGSSPTVGVCGRLISQPTVFYWKCLSRF